MNDYITLLGAEDVQRAGLNINSAAQTMLVAVSNLEDTLFRHRNFMDDWLLRFENVIKESQDD